MKKLILGSVVAAALVFTGCGDDDDTTVVTPAADTVKPTVAATASGAAAAALTLATDNEGVTEISITGADASQFIVNADKTVTIPSTPNTYNITVTAKDAAGNETVQDVVVTVTGGSASTVGDFTLGGKSWTALREDNDANATLDGRITYTLALAECQSKGMDLPTLEELEATKTMDDNKSSALKAESAFKFNELGLSALALWTKGADVDPTKGFALFSSNDTNDDGQFDTTGTDTEYFTCVK